MHSVVTVSGGGGLAERGLHHLSVLSNCNSVGGGDQRRLIKAIICLIAILLVGEPRRYWRAVQVVIFISRALRRISLAVRGSQLADRFVGVI